MICIMFFMYLKWAGNEEGFISINIHHHQKVFFMFLSNILPSVRGNFLSDVLTALKSSSKRSTPTATTKTSSHTKYYLHSALLFVINAMSCEDFFKNITTTKNINIRSLYMNIHMKSITLILLFFLSKVQWAAVRTSLAERRVPPHQGKRPLISTPTFWSEVAVKS